MKKRTLPTYTILIRTPAGTQTIIETNDFAKARRTYAQYKGSCRLCIDGQELHILEADRSCISLRRTGSWTTTATK